MKYIHLPNGFKCYYQHWFPEKPRGIVVMVHGLGDHIGRYNEFVSYLSCRGYACALYDQRGFGQSEGRRGHVSSFDQWIEDLDQFIEFTTNRMGMNVPMFLMGGSLGGLICFNYLVSKEKHFAGLISAASAIMPGVKVTELQKKLARGMSHVLPRFTVDNRLDYDHLTRDPDERAALISDTIFHRRVSIGAVVEIEKKVNLVMALPMRICIPALILTGSEDVICLPEGSKKFTALLSSSDKNLIVYDGMRHDILHDIGRKRVMDDIVTWLDKRTGGRNDQ